MKTNQWYCSMVIDVTTCTESTNSRFVRQTLPVPVDFFIELWIGFLLFLYNCSKVLYWLRCIHLFFELFIIFCWSAFKTDSQKVIDRWSANEKTGFWTLYSIWQNSLLLAEEFLGQTIWKVTHKARVRFREEWFYWYQNGKLFQHQSGK